MLTLHCSCSGQTHYSVYAVDRCNSHNLSIPECLAIVHLKIDQSNSLPLKIEIAIGMKLMVLANIAPDAGLANGSCGIVTDIVLDPRESVQDTVMTTQLLHFPPLAILFFPLNVSPICMQGLPNGTVPIFPQMKSFTVCNLSVKWTQFPFTHKAQGQTMDCILVDLTKPPTGALSPFGAYVALSHARGRYGI